MRLPSLPAVLLAAAALLGAPGGAGAAEGSLLDPLEAAVQARYDGLDPIAGRPPPDVRALRRATLVLAEPRFSLLDDLRRARPVARILDRHWAEDGTLQPVLADAFASLEAALVEERNVLLSRRGSLGSAKEEARLERGIAAVNRLLGRAVGAPARAAKARLWGRACRVSTRTQRGLGILPPEAGPPPFAGLAPDFALDDANPNSATSGLPVSPRDYDGLVTAWFFTRVT
jgi:hypothetical protein